MQLGLLQSLILAMLALGTCGCPAHGTVNNGSQADAGTAKFGDAETVSQQSQEAEKPEEFPVPAWLVANPPITALFPPCGDVVTLGLLGSLERSRREPVQPLEEAEFVRWYIYSAESELIAGLPEGIHWWIHYFPDWQEKFDAFREQGVSGGDMNSYLLFYREEPDSIVEMYDYDGTLLPEGFDPWSAPVNRMHVMSGDELLELAENSRLQ